MTSTTVEPVDAWVERSVRIYRSLLVVYPTSFRDEYGDDLVQGFRDLLVFSTSRRFTWWATARDLLSSAARERTANLSGSKPPWRTIIVVVAAIVAAAMIGGVPATGSVLGPLLALPALILVGLPIVGLIRLREAWIVHRTTGGAIRGRVATGVACFVPGPALVVLLGEDAGYFVFIGVALALIVGSGLGILWGVAALVSGAGDRYRRRRSLIVLVPSLLILGAIIVGSYNSYRQSLGPPGDHSVKNASADTRALWDAANAADVAAVTRLTTTTCADPWVKFPVGNGRHNAKGQAEELGLSGPDSLDGQWNEIADILGDYMDDWDERCNKRPD